MIGSLQLRSGVEHSDLELVVRVGRDHYDLKLAVHCDLELADEVWRRRRRRRRRRRQRTADTKSNNPHLTDGEYMLKKVNEGKKEINT